MVVAISLATSPPHEVATTISDPCSPQNDWLSLLLLLTSLGLPRPRCASKLNGHLMAWGHARTHAHLRCNLFQGEMLSTLVALHTQYGQLRFTLVALPEQYDQFWAFAETRPCRPPPRTAYRAGAARWVRVSRVALQVQYGQLR